MRGFFDLAKPHRLGYATKSGKKVWHFAAPGYTPMISDGQRLFLVGYESLRALEPK